MRNLAAWGLVAVLVAAIGSCSLVRPGGEASARRTWEDAHISNYTLRVSPSSMGCGMGSCDYTVTVVNGTPTLRPAHEEPATVEELFDAIDGATRYGGEIQVQYDSVGVPVHISYTNDQVADAEWSYDVDFQQN